MAGERTEKATPKKREEARKQGQVAKSTEVNSAIVLLATFGALAVTAPKMMEGLKSLFTDTFLLTSTPNPITAQSIGALSAHWMMIVVGLMMPIVVAAVASGVFSSVIQNRPHITPTALQPNFGRLNVASGLKNMLGTHALIELGKDLVKITVIAAVAVMVIYPEIPQLLRLSESTPTAAASYVGGLILRLAFAIIGVLIPIAIADAIIQRRKHEKQLMMSKQDVKDESKNSDIAPEIKSAIKRRQMQMSRQRMLAQVPSADVIVTNPTHYAVALRYGKDVASPIVLAKGVDLLALRIREIAADHDIAIVENRPLARALYANVEVGREIPAEFFGAVAEVLAFVYRTSRRRLSWA